MCLMTRDMRENVDHRCIKLDLDPTIKEGHGSDLNEKLFVSNNNQNI